MAYAAIVSTLIFGSLFVAVAGVFQTGVNYDSAVEEDQDGQTSVELGLDTDEDGLSDREEETLYGTDINNVDTDGDGMSDYWEVQNGLDPKDGGDADPLEQDPGEADVEDSVVENETNAFPDPNQGPNGDPDNDGLTNQQEYELNTDPQRYDTDNDGLNDRWESLYMTEVEVTGGTLMLFNPLNANWDCELLSTEVKQALQEQYNTDTESPSWEDFANSLGAHSCDAVLDFDSDNLPNYLEELFGTNPSLRDSDGDLLTDDEEISSSTIEIT